MASSDGRMGETEAGTEGPRTGGVQNMASKAGTGHGIASGATGTHSSGQAGSEAVGSQQAAMEETAKSKASSFYGQESAGAEEKAKEALKSGFTKSDEGISIKAGDAWEKLKEVASSVSHGEGSNIEQKASQGAGKF
jgi:hypothetical protein